FGRQDRRKEPRAGRKAILRAEAQMKPGPRRTGFEPEKPRALDIARAERSGRPACKAAGALDLGDGAGIAETGCEQDQPVEIRSADDRAKGAECAQREREEDKPLITRPDRRQCFVEALDKVLVEIIVRADRKPHGLGRGLGPYDRGKSCE